MGKNSPGEMNRAARASFPPGDRQLLVKNLRIDHDRSREALTAIKRFHFPVIGGVADTGGVSVLAGDSRTGKSFAAKAYCDQFPHSTGPDGMLFPVVYSDMPPNGGYRAILENLADAKQLIHTRRMNNAVLLNNVLRSMRYHQVELIVLDEFQDVFDPDKPRLVIEARRLLRKILNLGTLNIICVGLLDTYELMTRDEQLTGRGGLPYKILRPYEWGSEEERALFRLLCDEIDSALPFNQKSGLGTVAIAQRLFFVTYGIIGRLKDFLFAAACIAINDEADRIESHHLATAYEERKPRNTTFNPFLHDMSLAPKPKAPPRPSFPSDPFSKTRRPKSDEALI